MNARAFARAPAIGVAAYHNGRWTSIRLRSTFALVRALILAALSVAALACSALSCAAGSGADWVRGIAYDAPEPARPLQNARAPGRSEPGPGAPDGRASPCPQTPGVECPAAQGNAGPAARPPGDAPPEEGSEPPIVIGDHGRPATATQPASGQAPGTFRNTYYDFPSEGAGSKDATIFDASCVPLARVTTDFHDRVCVQGSGRLSTGPTVSYARRDCACAAVCPRTGQRICFEHLDPAQFPHGRGAMGRPIAPLRTVAVDSTVIPLGTPLYIPELAGVRRADGTLHDGCFVAEDRGIRVVGRHVDVFSGDPAETARLNAIVPSNRGVRVFLNDARCPGAAGAAAGAGAPRAGAGPAM